jgi:hypothetical protein
LLVSHRLFSTHLTVIDFSLVLFVSGFPAQTNYEDNLHPLILPPPIPWLLPTSPRQYSIPYTAAPSISSTALGACCAQNSSSGFLGLIDFSVLNESLPAGQLPNSLGVYPAQMFSFPPYPSDSKLFAMLKRTTASGWLAALVFHEFDEVNGNFHIGIARNITQRGAQASVGTLNLLDNAMLRMLTQGEASLVVRLKVCILFLTSCLIFNISTNLK